MKWCKRQHFVVCYSADVDDFDMTYGNLLMRAKCRNILKKYPAFKANNSNIEKVVINRWPTIWDFIFRTVVYRFLSMLQYSELYNRVRRVNFLKNGKTWVKFIPVFRLTSTLLLNIWLNESSKISILVKR